MFGTSYMGYRPKQNNIRFIENARRIKLSWVLLPKTCAQSGKKLWLVLAYRVQSPILTRDPGIFMEERWFDPIEFLVLSILREPA